MKTFEKLRELREMTQRFVFDNPKSFKNAERLANRFKLETDSEKQMGNYFLAVTGKVPAISKWLKALEKGEGADEGTVTEASFSKPGKGERIAGDSKFEVLKYPSGLYSINFVNVRDGDIFIGKEDLKRFQKFISKVRV